MERSLIRLVSELLRSLHLNECPFDGDSCLNHSVDTPRIAELLHPYIVGLALPPMLYDQVAVYLDLLLRWNAKTNLTAIRDPGQIVTRHFGESLFAASVVFGEQFSGTPLNPSVGLGGNRSAAPAATLADLGSGAGFPGLPIKLAFPTLHVTLIESQNKKATFLKEVIRALRLEGVEVYSGRAEEWGRRSDVVTLRAVDKFDSILPTAASLLVPGGRLCLLIGMEQATALKRNPKFGLEVEKSIPNRQDSMVLVGNCA